ncbi:hypothetical protein BI091_gp40 [Enterococcus phage SANTOR1]|uniref:Uncharacterized protein n=1 Tax=Enterococcus phage SANTOR1 TaxID=1871692 RepID=A0A1B1PA41_9CAUD|nr:hypothetical protein BI091_gp40 [Enterococcus phage SANTOR1]ANT41019.1 hypothetical protein SANTOR1_0200 [Enterococcus phage SANTOR1]
MKNTGTIIGLICGFIIAGSTATMGILDMKEEMNEAKQEVKLYKGLNERQQDIILEYKVVSGIEVSSITKTLDNKELDKKSNNWRKNKMNENMEVLTAVLVAFLVGIFTIVFTGSRDAVMIAWSISFVLTFLAAQTFKEDK